jgi:outer membrane receptor protein involved in Fe transport
VKVTTFSGQVGYQIQDIWQSNFKFDVNVYSGLGNLEGAWHRPAFNAIWTNTFTVKDKLLLASDFYMMTGLKGKNYVTDREVKLKSIIDLNFKATYLLSDHLNLFISVNNILNKSYQRYLYYPTQGVNFLGGLSYSF